MDSQHYLAAAAEHCERRGSKLTALRRQVLALVLNQSGVVKAYQILAELQKERGVAAPPTVYRALDFLVEHGLLHKVEALNGFIVCDHFDCQHESLILVCEQCGRVQEIDAGLGLSTLRQASQAVGFDLSPQNLVLAGRCRACTV